MTKILGNLEFSRFFLKSTYILEIASARNDQNLTFTFLPNLFLVFCFSSFEKLFLPNQDPVQPEPEVTQPESMTENNPFGDSMLPGQEDG